MQNYRNNAKIVPGRIEFIAICAILMSSIALAIDIMLPALGEIATAFALEHDNDRQLVIVMVFIGLTLGQLIFGPCSDSIGRKAMIITGLGIFCLGSILSAVAQSFEMLLIARAMQGFGAAGPRIVTVAMIRDRFQGQKMAQILSVITGIFILVPVVAPSIGQVLLFLMPWRALFAVLAFIGLLGGSWLALRQKETLTEPVAFSLSSYCQSFVKVVNSRICMTYAVVGALCYGALMGYINTSQQLFQDMYGLGEQYALWFGASAAFISLSTFVNARLVSSYKLGFLCFWAISLLVVWSLTFLLYFETGGYKPEVVIWMIFNCISLFLLGMVFGNFHAIALSKMGDIAGFASAVVGSVNSALSLAIAWVIGASFNGTIESIVQGYFLCGLVALVLIIIFDKARPWKVWHNKVS